MAQKILLLIIFSVCTFSLQAQDKELEATKVKIGQQAPNFSFRDERGKTVSLNNFRGKLVMITFFATWCPPCQEELPVIQQEIYDKYKDNPNFKLLIFGREHSTAEVTKFKESKGFSMPFLVDKKKSVYSLFAQAYIPRNFLVDASGKIIFSEVGYSPEKFAELKKTISEELQK